jgi:RNA polymerase sigma factor for flagellar operon FliA
MSLGREPTDEEVAERLKVPLVEAQELIKKSTVASLVSLDEYLEQNHETGGGSLTAEHAENPAGMLEMLEVKQTLAEAIDQLPEREKRVITLYYYEELTLKEISAVLGVSESRVSQIHTKAVMLLQSKLGKYKHLLYQ